MRQSKTGFVLLDGRQYVAGLLHSITASKKNIYVASMTFAWSEDVEVIVDALVVAAQRGVRVELLIDDFAHFAAKRIKRDDFAATEERIRKTNVLEEKIRSAGAVLTYTGSIHLNPYKHRMHIKYFIIDDLVYSFGGINFSDDSFEHVDYMLQSRSGAIGRFLQATAKDVKNNKLNEDRELIIDSRTKVLIDCGRTYQSSIYQLACKLASSAKRIYCVSQMCPSGELAKIMKEKEYNCFFNTARHASFPTNMAIAVDSFRTGIKNSYTNETYLHAKCLLIVDGEGKKKLLTGSHNLSWRGVAYGTKEVALYSEDVSLWDQLHAFIASNVERTSVS